MIWLGRIACIAAVAFFIAACGVSWHTYQGQYNETLDLLNTYRQPCIDHGVDHPLCKITQEEAQEIEPLRAAAKAAIDNYRAGGTTEATAEGALDALQQIILRMADGQG